MAVDLSVIGSLAPIFAFLLVFLVSFATLLKSKILGDSKWTLLFVSFVIASLFVSVAGTVDMVLNVIPWVAVLLVSLFSILLLTGIIGGINFNKPLAIVFVIAFFFVFVFSAFAIYSEFITGYLPGDSFGSSGEPEVLSFLEWLYSPRVWGALLLIVISAAVSWVLVKK